MEKEEEREQTAGYSRRAGREKKERECSTPRKCKGKCHVAQKAASVRWGGERVGSVWQTPRNVYHSSLSQEHRRICRTSTTPNNIHNTLSSFTYHTTTNRPPPSEFRRLSGANAAAKAARALAGAALRRRFSSAGEGGFAARREGRPRGGRVTVQPSMVARVRAMPVEPFCM